MPRPRSPARPPPSAGERRDRHRQQRVRFLLRRARAAQQPVRRARRRRPGRPGRHAGQRRHRGRAHDEPDRHVQRGRRRGGRRVHAHVRPERRAHRRRHRERHRELHARSDHGSRRGRDVHGDGARRRYLGRRHDRPARPDGRGLRLVVHDDAAARDPDDRRGPGRRRRYRRRQHPSLPVRTRLGQRGRSDGDRARRHLREDDHEDVGRRDPARVFIQNLRGTPTPTRPRPMRSSSS